MDFETLFMQQTTVIQSDTNYEVMCRTLEIWTNGNFDLNRVSDYLNMTFDEIVHDLTHGV